MNVKEIYGYLIKNGASSAGACGLLGNLYAESGLRFDCLENLCRIRLREVGKEWTNEAYTSAVDSGVITREEFLHPLPGKQYGYGLAQWTTPSRKAGLYDSVKSRGVSIADPQTQMDWLIHELQTSYKSVWNVLINAQTVREASDIVLTKFECPADQSEAVKQKRAGYGQKYYEELQEVREMGTLDGLIARGMSEVGYVEKASAENLDSKTANKGMGNYTKYARDVSNAGLMGCQGQAWCCTFQFWLDLMEFGMEKALKSWNMTKANYVGYNCFSTYNAFKRVGKVGTEPKLGAVAIFTFSHAGRVVKIYTKDGRKVWDCLEGNTSSNTNDRNGGQVKIKTREWNDPTVKGFCYVDYEQEAIVPGWKNSGGRWWYQYGDGNYPAGDWAYLQEQTEKTWGWYLFDKDGYMLTGYQTDPKGRKVFLCPESGIHEGKCMVTDDQGALRIAPYDWDKKRYIL